MAFREYNASIITIATSVGLHILILPLVYSNSPTMAYPLTTKATHLVTPSLEQPEVELGIDESDASTLTWIGYKEYEEQLARYAEVEQAEMKAETDVMQPNPSLMTLKQIAKPVAELAEQFIKAMRAIEITLPSRDLPASVMISAPPETVKKTTETLELAKADNPADSVDKTNVKETAKIQPSIQNNPSDRDSDASSIIRISPDQLKSGKPIAAKGIVLRPRRPSFTANQLVTNSPSGLVADLFIDKGGKPVRVKILVSTGSSSIDRSVKASLFRWRASGDKIIALENDKTLQITIHITFSEP